MKRGCETHTETGYEANYEAQPVFQSLKLRYLRIGIRQRGGMRAKQISSCVSKHMRLHECDD